MRSRAGSLAAVVLWGLVCLGAGAVGQTAAPGGTVMGHVTCGDTQRPARFAGVVVFSVPSAVTATPTPEASSAASVQTAVKAQMDAMSAVTTVQTQTGIDGSFVAENVPPGDYYVMASMAGYVEPRNLVQAAYDAGEDMTKGIPGVPIVHVAAERTSEADITLSRGAAVEGRVLWDDGGAVNGATVTVESTARNHKNLPPQFGMMIMTSGTNGRVGTTDDRGRYRISGLAPGEYVVRAMLQTRMRVSMDHGRVNLNGMSFALPLMVYAPAAFHKANAKPVTLNAGEEHGDEDITFNLNGTHAVSGRVASAEDHHGLNQGQVILTDTNDKEFRRTAGLEADGSFSVLFVPPGTYTMAVSGSDAVVETGEKGMMITQNHIVHSYKGATQQVIVGDSDVTGQNIELTPSKGGAEEPGSVAGAEGTGVVFSTSH